MLLAGVAVAQAPPPPADAPEPAVSESTAAETGRRVVAVGDVHGAYNGVRSILRQVGLIDGDDRWIGGDAVLVQAGDFLDRGPGATKVAELLMELQRQAPEAGGEVIVLLGNHEVLNLYGDYRYLTKYIVRNLVDANSEKRREVSCNAYASFYRRRAIENRQKPPKRGYLLERCHEDQPLGFVEYLREIGPEGTIGAWMRQLPTAVEVGGVVFVHGGISPGLADRDLEKLNREVRREIATFDRARDRLIERDLILPTSGLGEVVGVARQLVRSGGGGGSGFPLSSDVREVATIEEWLTVREDGPLWFRGYANWSDEEGEAAMPAILDQLGAGHVVVGHSPQEAHAILPRFDSRVFLIDTGMLNSYYGGQPSALEIAGDRFTAVYLSHRSQLAGP